ncbi:MAG TPA: hypothetical protein VFR24_26150 [Candidatus Angelobacter sp.]|nr:hypothetical protein [Candidatus Angelobacter sp.]
MSSQEAKKAAEQYLKDQAKIMEKYGSSPKLQGDRYREAVNSTTRTFQVLSNTRSNPE